MRPSAESVSRNNSEVQGLLLIVFRMGFCSNNFGVVVQLDRAPALQAGGYGIVPHRLHPV